MRVRPQQAMLEGCTVLPVELQGGPADGLDIVQNSFSGTTSPSLCLPAYGGYRLSFSAAILLHLVGPAEPSAA